MLEKINIISIGSCVIGDILRCDPLRGHRYNITPYHGSISRGSWEPGKIALRLQEEMQNVEMKSSTARQFKYVTKNPTPYSVTKNILPNTVVIVDHSYEISNMFFDGNEIFDLILQRPEQGFPDWFGELLRKNTHGFDCGIKELALYQYHSLIKFDNYLESLNVPVIYLDNLFTRNVYDPVTRTIAPIIPLYNNSMHFKFVTKIKNELELFEYSQRVIDQFYKNVRRNAFSKAKFLSVEDRTTIFADLGHPWGYHPMHLHRVCREMLCGKLTGLIQEALAEHKAKQLIIL